MAWPFEKQKQDEGNNQQTEGKTEEKRVEKSPAELLAESLNTALEPFKQQLTSLTEKVEGMHKPAEKKADDAQISVLDDENAAFAQRMTPVLSMELDTRSELMKDRVSREYGDMWDAFKADIEEVLSKSNLQLRADPSYIRNVADMVIGRKAREKGFKFDSAKKTFFVEDAAGDAGQSTPKDDSGMTEKQRRVFERMGVPFDKAKETLKKLEFIH